MKAPRYVKSLDNRTDCVWRIWKGKTEEVIDPEIAERDRLAMKKLYQEKSGDYSY
jgi:hypothetical protein